MQKQKKSHLPIECVLGGVLLLLLSFSVKANLMGDGIILGGGICDDPTPVSIDNPATIDAVGWTGIQVNGCINAPVNVDDGDPNTIDTVSAIDGIIRHFTPDPPTLVSSEQAPTEEDLLLENAVLPTDQFFPPVLSTGGTFTLDYVFPDSDLLLLLSYNFGTDVTDPIFSFYPRAELNPLDLTIRHEDLIASGFAAGAEAVYSVAALLVDSNPTYVAQDGSELHAGEFGFFNITLGNPTPSPVPAPAAFWLFGTGLIGLVGFSKRRKAA